MSIAEQIRTDINIALKNKDGKTVTSLKTALGEAQRLNYNPADKDVLQALKKGCQSLNEVLGMNPSEEKKEDIKRELELYSSYLPKNLSLQEIQQQLDSFAGLIKSANSEGQAIGVAMKHFKSNNSNVDGKDVREAVNSIRG